MRPADGFFQLEVALILLYTCIAFFHRVNVYYMNIKWKFRTYSSYQIFPNEYAETFREKKVWDAPMYAVNIIG